MNITKIGVVGAGTMGNGIAQVFAVAGYDVVMRDLQEKSLDRGMTAIGRSLDRLVGRGNLSAEAREATIGRIRPCTELSHMADRDLVIEAIVGKSDVKAQLVQELDAICRQDTILATNTSSISVTRIAPASCAPGRVIGMHFFNPVPMRSSWKSSELYRLPTKSAIPQRPLRLRSERLHASRKIAMDSS